MPYDVYSYDTALGAGVLSFDGTVTGLKAFRDQLIIFTTAKIYRLAGSSVDDFKQEPITENMGCSNAFSIQEVGGDLVFQTKDGLRYLGATEKLGDFNIASLTENIQDKIETLLSTATSSYTTNSLQTSVTITVS